MNALPESPDRILRLPAVQARIPLSTATIYRRMAAGQFPMAIRLGDKAVGWRESEISAWIAGTWQPATQGGTP